MSVVCALRVRLVNGPPTWRLQAAWSELKQADAIVNRGKRGVGAWFRAEDDPAEPPP